MKNSRVAIFFTSIYLLVFTILTQFSGDLQVIFILFAISPFLLVWMVYTVLKYGNYTGKELSDDEEWGYEDISKEELNRRS